mmetsp:Transcript_39455/g.82504  ORF Transcript_39455/g.82504 Transcript_39455/m.82504 type:complete len:204 (-) Transcript_39455:321-932(-)
MASLSSNSCLCMFSNVSFDSKFFFIIVFKVSITSSSSAFLSSRPPIVFSFSSRTLICSSARPLLFPNSSWYSVSSSSICFISDSFDLAINSSLSVLRYSITSTCLLIMSSASKTAARFDLFSASTSPIFFNCSSFSCNLIPCNVLLFCNSFTNCSNSICFLSKVKFISVAIRSSFSRSMHPANSESYASAETELLASCWYCWT